MRVLEKVVLQAISALIVLGPLNDLPSENKVLDFLMNMPLKDEHVNLGVATALEVSHRLTVQICSSLLNRNHSVAARSSTLLLVTCTVIAIGRSAI